MIKISKSTAVKNAQLFETSFRAHRDAIAAAERKVKFAIADEEASKAVLKEYALQNDEKLFPDGVATAKIEGDVVIQRRSGSISYDFSLASEEDREYLMATYPDAFAQVKIRFIDCDDTKAMDILRRCASQGVPTYIVTLASNSKATKR